MLVQSSACSSLPGFGPGTWRTSSRLWGRSEADVSSGTVVLGLDPSSHLL